MNDLLHNFGEQLKGSSGGTKAIAVLVGIAMVAVIGIAVVLLDGPDYQLAFSGLTDHEFPKVTKALAAAGVPFRPSQPPGPFSVFVDDDDRSKAYQAVYGAGALDKPLRGILSESGVSSVFSSSEERKQGVRKREWGEIEKMLEVLDFVMSATVRTAAPTNSPMPTRDAAPKTASVALRVVHQATLSRDQKDTVANLVSRGLGIKKENIVISDQSGRNLFDGSLSNEEEMRIKDLLSHQGRYDSQKTEVANLVLRDVLGPRKARVTVNSEWDYAQSTTSREEAIGAGAMISESKIKTDRSVPSGTPPAVGVTANAIDPTAPNSLQSNTPDGGVEMKENTSEEKKEYRPTISREDKVEYVPRLLRLSVALFLDKSLEGEEIKLEDLESAIKASVGFTQDRDVFSSVIWPFAGNEPVEVVGDAVPESAPSEPNSMFDKLFERGLEIGTGLIFLTLLLRSLKKSAAPSVQRGPGGRGPLRSTGQPGAPGEIDPELLARLQIENLLDSDPDKLGDVLTQWIQEDEPVEAK